jgi:triacylglycerol lipase
MARGSPKAARRARGRPWPVALALALLALTLATPAASAQSLLDASPPGANDWACEPSADKPHPVILLHGLGADKSINFTEVSPALADAGFCVYAVDYGNRGLQSLTVSIATVAAFVERVREATGAQRVALLGHSEGAAMSMYYTRRFGPEGVSHVVAVAGPLHGTAFPLAAQGPLIGCFACADLATGSPFITELTRPPEAPLPTRWRTVVTQLDELVLPFTSGLLDESLSNVDNFVLQEEQPGNLSEHAGIIADPLTIALAIEGLSETALPISETQPDLALTRRCIGDGRLRMNVVGDEAVVRDVSFKVDKRLVRRDDEASFEQVLDRRTLSRTRATQLRAVVYLDGPGSERIILERPLPRCGLPRPRG